MFLFSTFFLLPFFPLFSFLPLHAKLTNKGERKQRGIVVTARLFSQEKRHVEIKAKVFFKLSNYSFFRNTETECTPILLSVFETKKGQAEG